MAPGQRVKIQIANPCEWAYGAAASMNDKHGVIEEVALPRYAAGGVRECSILVRFDTPAPKWWANQTPATRFWFAAKDLVLQ